MSDNFFKQLNYTPKKPAAGKILISQPLLFDPHFKRTLVLLTEHNEDGTVGFILNRPIKMTVNKAIEDFPKFDASLFYGGPVSNTNLFYLHTLGEKLKDSKEVIPGLYWGGDFNQLKLMIDTKQVTHKDIHFYTGYSGWSVGQLDGELKEKSWIVGDITAHQAMNANTKESWKEILSSLGKKYKILSNFPEDPSLN